MINELTENEIKLLSIISLLVITNRQATTDRIEYLIGIKIPDLLDFWQQTLEKLIDKGIMKSDDTSDNTIYKITEYGNSFARWVVKNNCLDKYFYNEFYKRAAESRAHAEFCRSVYGENFCQHGMLDMYQLDKLIETSEFDFRSNVLELGCGNGFITEYISDKTKCHLTGIDIAADAIKHASDRTKDKKERLLFEAKDMENLDYEEHSFDAVISIDTLYFVKDLESTLKSICKVLKPSGKIYIFYHTPPDIKSSSSCEPTKESMLGKALDKLNYIYETVDFTKENKKHWEVKKGILLELKQRFEEEGNMFLYRNRMAECMGNLCEFYRFLYIVNPQKLKINYREKL